MQLGNDTIVYRRNGGVKMKYVAGASCVDNEIAHFATKKRKQCNWSTDSPKSGKHDMIT